MKSLANLKTMPDPGIQTWLRRVTPEDLAMALTEADEPIRAAVYRNMSPRARAILASDVALLEEQNPSTATRAQAVRAVVAVL